MGRPRKNPEAVVAAAVDAAVDSLETPKDPLARLKEVLGEAIDADPRGVQKALADVLGVSQGTPRKVEERPRKVSVSKEALEIQAPEPEEAQPGVIFASPHQGFRQVLKPSQKKYYGDGNVDIIPPVVAEFEQGQIRLTDPELIAAMRKKIAAKKGGIVQVVELKDEIAEQVKAGRVVGPVVSKSNSINDKLEDLVTV